MAWSALGRGTRVGETRAKLAESGVAAIRQLGVEISQGLDAQLAAIEADLQVSTTGAAGAEALLAERAARVAERTAAAERGARWHARSP
jgi:hypothetical protein